LINVQHVGKSFAERRVIDDLSFAIGSGEVVGLLGPNGSGKTTVIRLINGLLRPDQGSISIMGLNPLSAGHPVRQASGVLTESADFYRNMSGLDNLRFFASLYQVHDPGRPRELLRTFGLEGDAHKPVSAYSTGMRKRLGLAKALLHQPEILFLDEPTNGLDPEGTRLVLESIRELKEAHDTTILICSHLLQQLELVCERYLFIRRGRLIEQGTLPELRAKYHERVILEVITDLPLPEDGYYRGMPVIVAESTDQIRPPVALVSSRPVRPLQFALTADSDVPDFLRQVILDARVYGASVSEQNLESLYFRIQEGGAA
jgi:ABC-2 type transport system ATP-binding protein